MVARSAMTGPTLPAEARNPEPRAGGGGGLRSPHAEDADRGGAPARRRAGQGGRAVPRRRQQPRLPRVLRAARGAADDRRAADERAPRLHEHALQAPLRLRPSRRRGRVGHPADPPDGDRRDVQGGAPADARPAPRAVPALPPDRRGVRLLEPRVRGLGGGRRDRDARDARGRGRDPHLCRLHRPGRVPALQRERLADDDAAGRRGRPRLHARAGRAPVRRPPRPGAGLHRPEGRHVRQHPRHPGNRGQDRRSADRAVRLARGGHRPRRRALARPLEGRRGARRPGARVEGPRDDAAGPSARRRGRSARRVTAGSLHAQGDLPPLRVPRPAEPGRHARRGAAGGRAGRDGSGARALARGAARAAVGADRRRGERRSGRRRGRAGRRGRDRRPVRDRPGRSARPRSRRTTRRRSGSAWFATTR